MNQPGKVRFYGEVINKKKKKKKKIFFNNNNITLCFFPVITQKKGCWN